MESIEKSLATRGQVLLGIGDVEGYPACKDGWTIMPYYDTPIRLLVMTNPGMQLHTWTKDACVPRLGLCSNRMHAGFIQVMVCIHCCFEVGLARLTKIPKLA